MVELQGDGSFVDVDDTMKPQTNRNILEDSEKKVGSQRLDTDGIEIPDDINEDFGTINQQHSRLSKNYNPGDMTGGNQQQIDRFLQ
jgi:hypothetical protein